MTRYVDDWNETSTEKQIRLDCDIGINRLVWNCYQNCSFWDGSICTKYEVRKDQAQKMKCHDCDHVNTMQCDSHQGQMTVCSAGHWRDHGTPPEADDFDDDGKDPWENCQDYKQCVTLLPCPFCGSPAKLTAECDMLWAVCSNHDCRAERITRFDEPEDAISDWNKRPLSLNIGPQ